MATIPEALRIGLNYYQEGDLEQAENVFRQILESVPTEAQAWCLLGCVELSQKNFAEAATSFGRAIEHRPGFAEAHNNLGYALAHEDRTAEALAFYHRAIELKPDYAEAHNNLGTAFSDLGRVEEAIVAYRQALVLNPQYAVAYQNLGSALARLGKMDEAIAAFQEAIRLWPQNGVAYVGLGSAFGRLGSLEQAAQYLERALTIDPNSAPAQTNLGLVYVKLGRMEEAIDRFQAALRIHPGSAEAHNNLGHTLVEVGQVEEAKPHYRQALRSNPDYASAHSNLLMALSYDPRIDQAALLQEHRAWEARFAYDPMPPVVKHKDPNRRLRIGYVSADLRKHPVAAFLKPILGHHDSAQFEVFCYAESTANDSMTESLQKLTHGWCNTLPLSDRQLAEQIRADGIDVLIDLAGHSGNGRLRAFTYKPAPVQITYLGYPNTTGLQTIDYLLTDEIANPSDAESYCVERLWKLPGGFSCFAPRQDAPAVSPAPCLARGHVTFGSTHALSKLNGDVLDLWSRLLKAAPQARLLIFRHTLSSRARTRLQNEFRQRGIGGDRVELRSRFETPDFLDIYRDIDIVLDAFPWSGHTTACEAAWMGVPTLTLPGVRRSSRLAASVLHQLGLDEWIARSEDEFLAKGAHWVADLSQLGALRSQLRDQMAQSPLCDGAAFTHKLEASYRQMWQDTLAR